MKILRRVFGHSLSDDAQSNTVCSKLENLTGKKNKKQGV
jgi:hypothetical protein